MGTIAINNLYIAKMPNSCKECPLTYLDTGDDAYFGSNERRCVIDDSCIDAMVSERAYDCPLVEAIPKANYEARLKADMVAMLEEISLEFDEQYHVNRHKLHDDFLNRGLEQVQSIIQQKIDKLRGEQA